MIFMLTTICIIGAEFLFYKRNIEYIGLLRRLDSYLTDFRHLYYKTASISAAFEETENDGMQKIKALKPYKLFMLLCEIVKENGDTVTDDGSVFLKNLSNLRREISESIRNLEERKYEFSGMVLVCCAPLVFSGIVEKWAINSMRGMESFYLGVGGVVVKFVLWLSVAGGYIYIIQKRERLYFGQHRKADRSIKEEEIKNLRSIILMLKDIKGMTVIKLIAIMNDFAESFKVELDKCLNEYGFFGREAIQNLKKTATDKRFKQLAENLLNCDVSGISNAFEEINLEQESFKEEQELLRRETLKKEAAYAHIVSMVPMCIVVVLHLTLPFIIESMTMLEEVINNIKGI